MSCTNLKQQPTLEGWKTIDLGGYLPQTAIQVLNQFSAVSEGVEYNVPHDTV